MTWDQVCGDFEMLSLNWDPALYPNTAIRHWYVFTQQTRSEKLTGRSWPKKPDTAEARDNGQGKLRSEGVLSLTARLKSTLSPLTPWNKGRRSCHNALAAYDQQRQATRRYSSTCI